MKEIIILILAIALLFGCATTKATTQTDQEQTSPAIETGEKPVGKTKAVKQPTISDVLNELFNIGVWWF